MMSVGSPLGEQLGEAMNELIAFQGKLSAARGEAEEATVSVLSKDRSLTVVIAGKGNLRELKFHGTEYGVMPPAQLSAVLVATINEAREKLAIKVQKIFEPLAGFGSKLGTSMIGGTDLDELTAPLLELLNRTGDEPYDGRG